MARPLRKRWACTNCGKMGNHGRRCVGLDKFYDQPQCTQCRSRYRHPVPHIVHTDGEDMPLAELRTIYARQYPGDSNALKRARGFMLRKLTRKGVLTIS